MEHNDKEEPARVGSGWQDHKEDKVYKWGEDPFERGYDVGYAKAHKEIAWRVERVAKDKMLTIKENDPEQDEKFWYNQALAEIASWANRDLTIPEDKQHEPR